PPLPPPDTPPPPKPLEPDPDGLDVMVPAEDTVNWSMELENDAMVKGWAPTYQPAVAAACSASGPKARAHFSVHPNTTAYGRYFEKMFSCSSNRASRVSAVSMYVRNPSTRRASPVPRGVRRGMRC